MMRAIALALNFCVVASNARKVQTDFDRAQDQSVSNGRVRGNVEGSPVDALTSLFLALSPTSTINPAGAETHFQNQRSSVSMQQLADSAQQLRAPLNVKEMPGVSLPFDFFDPLGFCRSGTSEGKIRFYREVEIKHCRVAMLAAVGIPVGENFHPLWGGNIDVPSVQACTAPELQDFWPQFGFLIACLEILSVFTFNSPLGQTPFGSELWSIRSDYDPGNLGFDPLGLMPQGELSSKDMKTKELNNGRLAMIAVIGMVVQELLYGEKLR
jgi:hypothetical protein